jgi:hypothetical protein
VIQSRTRARQAGKKGKSRKKLRGRSKATEARIKKNKEVWNEAVAEDGNKYFWHADTKESVWQLPAEAQMPANPMQFAAAVMVQSVWRRARVRVQIQDEVNAAGFLMAMPGTPQGKSGWYQTEDGGNVLFYEVDEHGHWREDPAKPPMELMVWYRSDYANVSSSQ